MLCLGLLKFSFKTIIFKSNPTARNSGPGFEPRHFTKSVVLVVRQDPGNPDPDNICALCSDECKDNDMEEWKNPMRIVIIGTAHSHTRSHAAIASDWR
jgi:hypothetical protein